MKPNYALIIGLIVVVTAIAIPVILGLTQGTKVHMDDGDPVEKNITVMVNERIEDEHHIIDADGVMYYTSARTASGISVGKNYTMSVQTVNNHTGYWILTYMEIKPAVNKTKVK
jgi:hypothetical protein